MRKLVLSLMMLIGLQVQAGEISVNVSEETINVGDVLTLTLSGESMAVFDSFNFNLEFDTSLFSYDAGSLTTGLWLDGLIINPIATGLAIGFLDTFNYWGDMLLVEFQLTALAAGSSDFAITNAQFYDSFTSFDPIDVDIASGKFVEVAAVPEPSVAALMLLAVLGLVRRQRHMQN